MEKLLKIPNIEWSIQGSDEKGCMWWEMGDEPRCGSHEYNSMDWGLLGSHQKFFIHFVLEYY